MVRKYRNIGKTYKTPNRPFDKERLDKELKQCGEYGLRCKREIWRTSVILGKMRETARTLLTLDEAHPRRQLEGAALLRRCSRYGLLDSQRQKLDFVLAMTLSDLLDRRLQTLVFKLGLAKSIHHARVLIKQRHIRVGKRIVSVPSFMVRVESEKHIDFAPTSPFGGGAPGRVKKLKLRREAQKGKGDDGGDEDED
eukprot:NODE_1754_length_747_cov_68.817742_g1705_i0.p1 GENE.NODE_1754_length_747_cov_68.817742_g1705_i0~~NODE_1754_length_747_cov_68.817742_g1705_i0.p1  ORF type:complete len:196 (-),score=56.44 NODE_1754_length_747_cov_68.817742_g1705_i0:81-668(-)